MRQLARFLTASGFVVAFLAAAASAHAQGPTPEGTVITNTATVTWSDPNSNTYPGSSASASVTVGFLAGPDVASPASVTPAAPSTGNELAFTITNSGNGTDQFSVATTAGTGATITGYKLGATTYATLAALNAALATTNVTMGSSVTVTVVYTIAPGQGGQTIPLSLTATSARTTTSSDTSTTNVSPPVSASVNTTPDGGTVQRLPSNGTQYTATFTLQNTGNASDTFTLTGGHSGSVLTIVSVNGTAGTSGFVTLASGGSTTVDVVYTVGSASAGSTDVLSLTATSGNNSGVSDGGSVTVTVIAADVSITKSVFRDDQTTAITGSDRVIPGEYLQYRVTVTNGGAGIATTVQVQDILPSELTYVSVAGDGPGWTLSESGGTVSASLSGTLAPSASRYFWIRVRVK